MIPLLNNFLIGQLNRGRDELTRFHVNPLKIPHGFKDVVTRGGEGHRLIGLKFAWLVFTMYAAEANLTYVRRACSSSSSGEVMFSGGEEFNAYKTDETVCLTEEVGVRGEEEGAVTRTYWLTELLILLLLLLLEDCSIIRRHCSVHLIHRYDTIILTIVGKPMIVHRLLSTIIML
jgi:hypothetical protein